MGEPGIPRLGHRAAGRLRRLRRDVIRAGRRQPLRVIADTLGLLQGDDLRRGQHLPGRPVILVPGVVEIATAGAGRGARAERGRTARGAPRRHAAAGELVIPLVAFRRLSLPTT